MSEAVLQPSSKMTDTYYRHETPLPHTYWNAKSKLLDFTSTDGLPSLEEIKEVKEELCKIKRTLKLKELCSLFEKCDSKTTDEAILCTIVGLREDYGEWLFEMDIQMPKTHADKHYTEMAFKENKKSAGWIQSGCYGVKNLQYLGFSEEMAAIISSDIPNDFIDLQKPSFWALHYLDHIFTYHPLLSNCPRYPVQADTLDAWFDVSFPLNNSDEPSSATGDVKIINISSRKSAGNLLVEELLGKDDTDHSFLYHSTDHDSAMSIVNDGILLEKGQENQDFSSRDGFYLSETFENAKSLRCKGKQAIVVYRIENNLLDASQQNGWDFTRHDKGKWERVIKYCRNGYSIKDKQMEQELKEITFIRGPRCSNPEIFKNKRGQMRTNPQPRDVFVKGFGETDKIQVCIRDHDYADNFGKLGNIACVIFY